MKTKETFLEELYHLVLSVDVTDDERPAFLRAKQALEEGQDLQRVALNLKRELSPIMAEQKFSEEGLAFFKRLSKEYLGLGPKGAVFIL
ncbi:MAG: bacteriocin immunity protein [Lactococcus sp.]